MNTFKTQPTNEHRVVQFPTVSKLTNHLDEDVNANSFIDDEQIDAESIATGALIVGIVIFAATLVITFIAIINPK